jgi:GPI-anchor transamidase subunit T
MWKEDVRVHPLVTSSPLPTSSLNSGTASDRSFLVQSTFFIDQKYGTDKDRLVPVAIRSLLSSVSSLQRLELTYTRGNRGLFRFPAWSIDRGSGLGLESRFQGSDVPSRDLTVLSNSIARLIGCSASSILDRKTFAWYDVHGGKEAMMVGYSTQDFPCVESIAQWMKLLPCGGQQGLSGFVKSLRMLELPYHSLRMILDPEKGVTIEVSAIVHKNEASLYLKDNDSLLRSRKPMPSEHVSSVGQILRYLQNDDWNMVACPVVKESEVLVSARDPRESATRYSPFGKDENEDSLEKRREISRTKPCIQAEVSNGIQKNKNKPENALLGTLVSYIRTERDVIEYDDNMNQNRVFVRHVIPWEIVCSRRSLVIYDIQGNTIIQPNSFFWLPPKPREHAGILEVNFDLPPMRNNSNIVSIELDIERTILSVFDYPADMSRGVDIPAPLVCVGPKGPTKVPMGDITSHECEVLVAGQNTLVQLPIPDASMPFNVACFTATLLSLIFGSVISMILWNKSELKIFKASRASPKARIQRLIFIMILGGGVLLYLDPSYQAFADSYISQLRVMLGL